jgi:hypothetical protein
MAQYKTSKGGGAQRLLPSVCLPLLLFFSYLTFSIDLSARQKTNPHVQWGYQRAEIQQRLTQSGGKYLIFVRYNANHDVDKEWVYNESDIDHSRVVWARDKGDRQNSSLIRYYADRTVYLLVANDDRRAELIPMTVRGKAD